MRFAPFVFSLLLVVASLASPQLARAQQALAGDTDELVAFEAAGQGRWVRARELATKVIRDRPCSYIGHFVLGLAQHEGEANFPLALREEQRARECFKAQHGEPPSESAPWQWHAMILRALVDAYGSLERHEERLAVIRDYEQSGYSNPMNPEAAWSLMKLRRFEEARREARIAVASGQRPALEMGLNALCAIEFEAGEYGRSYAACRDALDFGRRSPGGPGLVDLTNFAEAARTEMNYSESIALLQEATTRLDGGYGNPYLELGELLLRGGRVQEALDAFREFPRVRATRSPAIRESDRNETMRALTELYLVMGRADDAVRISERAVVMPDRRGHNSRHPNIDRAITALLNRAAHRLAAGVELEKHAGGGFWESLKARFRSLKLDFVAWQSGRRAVERLTGEDKLVGVLQIGSANGGITPPWLISDIVDVFGAGVTRSALERARATDRRSMAPAYYDAIEAEARLAEGDEAAAKRLATKALASIPIEDSLLRARAEVVLACALLELGDPRAAGLAFERALSIDPSILRRMRVALPARIRGEAGAEDVVSRLEASGRFDDDDATFLVEVSATSAGYVLCLRGPSRGFGCAESSRSRDASRSSRDAVVAFYDRCFSPAIPMTPAQIAALEGETRTSHTPLDDLLPSWIPQQDTLAPDGE